jgi:hypothetical protein
MPGRESRTAARQRPYGEWMGVVRRATAGRWAVALAGTIAIGLLPTALAALPANGSDRTPREIVAAARDSAAIPHEGYAETTGTLGLPDLPRLGQVAALLGGTTHARVWWRSPTAWRVDRVTATGESDMYAWEGALHTWDYEGSRLRTILGDSPVRLPRIDDLLPPQAARRILAGVTSHDLLTPLPAKRVAGRSADGVRIVPAATDSTIGRVDIYVDSASGLPLSLQLYPRGSSNAALSSRFLDVRLVRPDNGVLTPRIPPTLPNDPVTVPDFAAAVDTYAPFALPARLGTFERSRGLLSLGGTATYGVGLARFIVFPLTPDLGRSALTAATDGGGLTLTIRGGSAVLVETPLLNAVIARSNREAEPTDDRRGRSYLVAGLVDADTLTTAVAALFDNPPPARP